MRCRTRAALGLAIGLVVMTATDAWAADAWTILATKNPGLEWDWLSGVAAVSSTNVWAVGQYVKYEGGNVYGLIEHYDGSAWKSAYTKASTSLEAVKATSASNIWAVGDSGTGAIILRYDGTAWSKQSSPLVKNGFLHAVGASSASDAWAVGHRQLNSTTKMLVEHWNGTSWTLISLRNPGAAVNELYGVSATSPTNVWAVGIYGDSIGATKALVMHYDGTNWIRFAARNPGSCGAQLEAVSATSPSDVWASGYFCGPDEAGLVEHYDGTLWTATVGFPSAQNFSGITALSSSNTWAVGQATDLLAYAAHWNGSSWTRQSTPASPSGSDLLLSVAALSSSTAFAVGESIYNGHKIRTLAMVCCS